MRLCQIHCPTNALLALGYAGWAPDQLESELASNCWMFGKLEDKEIFSTDFDQKWSNSLKNSGVEPSLANSVKSFPRVIQVGLLDAKLGAVIHY